MSKVGSRQLAVGSLQSPASNRRLTAVIITHNVGDTIEACLTPLKKVADEILVLDSFSTDGTQAVCEKMGVALVPQEFLGFSQTKNLGNSMARHDWILSIDADEVLSDELVDVLKKLKPEEGKVYALDRLTNFCGKWIRHSGWYPDWKVRLFNRKHVWWEGDFVHETLHIPGEFQVERLSGKLYHYSYKSLDDHLARLEKYARLSAQEQFQKGKRATWFKRTFSPFARFFRTYFVKRGFLDGREGWIISRRNYYMLRRRYQLLKELWEQSAK